MKHKRHRRKSRFKKEQRIVFKIIQKKCFSLAAKLLTCNDAWFMPEIIYEK